MVQRLDPRRLLAWRLPSLLEVLRPIVLAAVLAFGLDLLLAPPDSPLALAGLAVVYPVGVGFALLVGLWLGKRAWPKRGRRLARAILTREVRRRRRPVLFLTDRPDFESSVWRRVLEVVGFAAGVSILVPAILQVAGAPPGVVQFTGGVITIVSLWGGFVLVPYWAFARLGIRRVDPVRWLVEPMSVGYAERLRLSNGALLLISAGAAANLAFRAGASGDEALVQGVLTVTRMVASILVVAAAGVVYYARVEKELVRGLEAEALSLGIRDGRGMSDGEFLPRIPPAASPGAPPEPREAR